MKASTEFRTARGWDAAVVAAILAAVLLGWLTAAGGNHAGVSRPAHSVAHASARAAVTPGVRAKNWG